jgi:dihydrofolate reductase
MRRVRYAVATSLDGYIAGPQGEADWITIDPDMDFNSVFKEFDTVLVGSRTYSGMAPGGKPGKLFDMRTFVFSRTLQQRDFRDVTVVSENSSETVAALREEEGKDIWLFGGGLLFRSLLNAGLVDTVEVAVIPILLGSGIPLLPAPARKTTLKLTSQKVYAKSGTVGLEYAVERDAAPAGSPARG